MDWNHPRAAAGAAVLLRVGADHGLSEEICLADTGLTGAQLSEPGAGISAEQELRIVRNLQDALPEVASLGLDAGRRYHLTTHGAWGMLLASSRDGWEALHAALRFVGLTWAFCEVIAEPRGDEMQLVFDDTALPADVRRFLALREIASAVTVAREASGLLGQAVVVHLRQGTPQCSDAFVEFFGAEPVFGADRNAMTVPRALLERDMPQADPHAAALTVEQCRRLLDGQALSAGVSGRVREMLGAASEGMPTIVDVAALLHMSSRTLRRQLHDQGTSFRQLLDEVRERRAEELLGSGMTVQRTARLIGYGATPAFTAAFRRWKGQSPRSWLRDNTFT